MSKFITLEGGDGTGKTTQARLLAESLRERGIAAITTREPGGSAGAEELRALLVGGAPDRWDNETELLLHFAARRDHVVKTIRPALSRDEWVICDRYMDSTIAYQVYGQNIDKSVVEFLYEKFIGSLEPDLTIILDVDPEIGLKRALDREILESRYEMFGPDFHHGVRDNFLRIAADNPLRCVVIEAHESADNTHKRILAEVSKKFQNNERA